MIREFDELKMYFGLDYVVNNKITIHQPTIGEIVMYGEQKYFSLVHNLVAIPSDMKSILFDLGLDYEEIDDFDLFIMLSKNLKQEDTKILFGDLDFSKFELMINTKNNEKILYDAENDITIDMYIYLLITDYLRKLHGIKKKVEKAANQYTKKVLIQEDRTNRELSRNKPYHSAFKSLISSMVNSEGFKYKTYELQRVGLYEFMDSVSRISLIIQTKALLNGMYSGMVDTSKIDKKNLNWLKELD